MLIKFNKNNNFTWNEFLEQEKNKQYFKKIISFLEQEKKSGKIIYPPEKLIFHALNITSFQNPKVIILGQDPYHGENQAHGLSFSVPENIPIPPSLKNIFKSIYNDFNKNLNNININNINTDLTRWAKQGVLLLNTVLSVEKSKAHSHAKCGWEIFTDNIIKLLDQNKSNLVFLLWGKHAISKQDLINKSKHLVLTSSHPSPLSAYRGFLTCKHFSNTNNYLAQNNKSIINWF